MSSDTEPEVAVDRLDERPPLLGSWRALYAVVLIALATYVSVGSALTWVYAP